MLLAQLRDAFKSHKQQRQEAGVYAQGPGEIYQRQRNFERTPRHTSAQMYSRHGVVQYYGPGPNEPDDETPPEYMRYDRPSSQSNSERATRPVISRGEAFVR